ncbi:MAG: cysteine--tRNA ligase [Candidatus Pacebacteria bacterium]|nr:cysteine--tRNA ligase [Candidatus Paceibacterota bacterium]
MELKIYDSLSDKEKYLSESKNKAIRLFVCGPTVYDYSHIGHARTYIFFDFFAKYLKSLGKKVFYLQNITDIDDKIIKKAKEQNTDPIILAKLMTKYHLRDMKTLGINSVTKYASATKFIKQIEKQVKNLIKKGFAYKIENDGWYFDIKSFPEYGKLSGRTAEGAEDSISRIDEAVDKKNKGDFCLWKLKKPNEPFWKSDVLGDGRPGWHIEDTAISENFFGPQYDIHGGGLDLKFPHHEAEIAQQECSSGLSPMVNIWMHSGMLTVNGKKMSKSLNNFLTIQDYLKNHSANSLKLLVLSSNYRSLLNYSQTLAEQAETSLKTVKEFITKLDLAKNSKTKETRSFDLKPFEDKFASSLQNDLNTPEAISAIFSLINEVNKVIWTLNLSSIKNIEKTLKNKLDLFGISINLDKIPQNINKLAKERKLLRDSKQFIRSDDLRKAIEELGYKVEDTPKGQIILKK